jgi:hypothetical protein
LERLGKVFFEEIGRIFERFLHFPGRAQRAGNSLIAELQKLGRDERYVEQRKWALSRLFTECGWKSLGEIGPDQSMGFKGEISQREHLLRVGD